MFRIRTKYKLNFKNAPELNKNQNSNYKLNKNISEHQRVTET